MSLDAVQRMLRALFLDAVSDLAPGVLDSLHNDVLPKFEAALASGFDAPPVGREEANPRGELMEELHKWQERWCLDEEWVGDAALNQMLEWGSPAQVDRTTVDEAGTERVQPARLRWTHIRIMLSDYPWLAMQRHECFTYRTPAFEPTWHRREDYAAAVLADFEACLAEYLDEMDAQAANAEGLVKSPRFQGVQRHMEWVVRYQVLRQPWAEIADCAPRVLGSGRKVGVSPEYVGRRVKQLADQIGLRLDPVRGPGRPLGSRTRRTTGHRVSRGRSRP